MVKRYELIIKVNIASKSTIKAKLLGLEKAETIDRIKTIGDIMKPNSIEARSPILMGWFLNT